MRFVEFCSLVLLLRRASLACSGGGRVARHGNGGSDGMRLWPRGVDAPRCLAAVARWC
jgi:hypothetical protein